MSSPRLTRAAAKATKAPAPPLTLTQVHVQAAKAHITPSRPSADRESPVSVLQLIM